MMRSLAVVIMFAFAAQSNALGHESTTKEMKKKEDVVEKDSKEKKETKKQSEADMLNELVDRLIDEEKARQAKEDKTVATMDAKDKVVERLANRMVDRFMDKSHLMPTNHRDLDDTTMGKTQPAGGVGNLATRGFSTPAVHDTFARSPLGVSQKPSLADLPRSLKDKSPRATAAQATQCGQAFDLLFGQEPSVMFLTLPMGPAMSEPKEKAIARKYSLVGNWDDWKGFHGFERVEDHPQDGPTFQATVPVPASKDIEFQMVGDGDWKNRYFPAGDGQNVFGPTHEGHGENWKHTAPKAGQKLQVKYHPNAGEKGTGRKIEAALI